MNRRALWLSAFECLPPHAVTHPIREWDLCRDFRRAGWDLSCPALVGYLSQGRVQLLSGSHRWAAARRAEIKMPVVVVTINVVARARRDGRDAWQRLMDLGTCNPTETRV